MQGLGCTDLLLEGSYLALWGPLEPCLVWTLINPKPQTLTQPCQAPCKIIVQCADASSACAWALPFVAVKMPQRGASRI